MADFDIEMYYQQWIAMTKAKMEFSICSMTCPDKKSAAETCLGCGKKLRMGKYTAVANTYKAVANSKSGMELDWCCSGGQLFALWVVLCRYDEEELQIRSESAKALAVRRPTIATRSSKTSKGIGYGSYTDSAGSLFAGRRYRSMGSPLNLQQRREPTDDMTKNIFALTVELIPTEPTKTFVGALCAMIELSLLHDRAGLLLRNDSLRNVTPRGDPYFAVFAYVERLGRSRDTDFLVCDERYPKARSAGLQSISMGSSSASTADRPLALGGPEEGMDHSLVDCMAKLATQSRNVISAAKGAGNEFDTLSGRGVLEVAKRIQRTYKPLAPKSHDNQSGVEARDWQSYHTKNCLEWATDMVPYMRKDLRDWALGMGGSAPDRLRRIFTEVAEMATSLPPNVFVKADDVRPDCIKALIVGPHGTPYEGGLFEFDFFCVPSYPNSPPAVQLRTTGGGKARFNPNLYPDGKVCLSLLNTWHGGDASEQWIAGKSTIASVLVSIQAMILCDQPIGNEPGDEWKVGTAASDKYNKEVQVYTVRHAMLDWLRNPDMRNGIWRDVVKNYFAANGNSVQATVRRWASQNPWFQGSGRSWSTNLVSEIEQALGVGIGKGKGRA